MPLSPCRPGYEHRRKIRPAVMEIVFHDRQIRQVEGFLRDDDLLYGSFRAGNHLRLLLLPGKIQDLLE